MFLEAELEEVPDGLPVHTGSGGISSPGHCPMLQPKIQYPVCLQLGSGHSPGDFPGASLTVCGHLPPPSSVALLTKEQVFWVQGFPSGSLLGLLDAGQKLRALPVRGCLQPCTASISVTTCPFPELSVPPCRWQLWARSSLSASQLSGSAPDVAVVSSS